MGQSSRSKSGSNRRADRRGAGRVSRRAQTVWVALLGAMTVVGGGLLVMAPKNSALNVSGRSFTPLMAAVGSDSIEAVFNTPVRVERGRWQGIVIHDSGSPFGNPETLEREALQMNLRGLGYHFVIGNGNGMSDGALFAGARWLQQQAGAHTGGPDADWYNRNTIGICLVGDGDRREPTEASMARLVRLVRALQSELGIPADRVVLHSEIAPTTSPGALFPAAALRAQLLPGP